MTATNIATAAGLAVVATSMLTCAITAPARAEGLHFSNPTALEDSSKYYSHVAVAPNGGKTIYVAGQGGLTKEKKVVPGKEAQIRQAFSNLKAALESAGATGGDVVSINVYFVGYTEADLGLLSEAEKSLFTPGKMPTSTLVPVPRLALDAELFEITAVAVVYPK
jgi:enamine deaminase RidA (YjgF/YER057c/UK114 family)